MLCFFGDGASNTGNFHESLNMAGAVEAAGGLHRREQPVRHVGPAGEGHRQARDRRPRLRLRHPGRGRRRHGRARRARGGGQGRRAGAQGRGAVAGRVQDLPLVRPLALRPARLPHQGGGGRLEGARPDPGLRPRGWSRRRSPRRPRSTPIEAAARKAIDVATDFAFASPLPAGRGARASTSTRPSTGRRADVEREAELRARVRARRPGHAQDPLLAGDPARRCARR